MCKSEYIAILPAPRFFDDVGVFFFDVKGLAAGFATVLSDFGVDGLLAK